MLQSLSHILIRVVERIAKLSPSRYSELTRGLVCELHSITNPGDRARFALGAITAITRLTIRASHASIVQAPGRLVGFGGHPRGAIPEGPTMPPLTTRQLLLRHIAPLTIAFTALSLLLLSNRALALVPQMSAQGASAGTITEALLLSVPFTTALTIPMSVFLAVVWVFTRLGAEGSLSAAQRTQRGTRRLLVPVLVAAAAISALTLVLNTQVVPRTNARLMTVVTGASSASDRTMTVSELRDAGRRARASDQAQISSRAAAYDVEIQKKFSLAAACMILAMAGAAAAMRFPQGGFRLVFAASVLVFTGYYLTLVGGENLADRQLVSPGIAMWSANAVLLVLTLLMTRTPKQPVSVDGVEPG